MRPFQLPAGRITPEWVKAAVLQLDPNDGEKEQSLMRKLEKRSARQMTDGLEDWLRRAVRGISEDEVHMIAGRLRDGSMRFRDVLQRALVAGADLGVNVAIDQFENIGFAADWTLANTEARLWATNHTDDVLRQLNTTNDRVVGEAVARWINNGEPLSSLINDLQTHFGRTRAEMIASTETTRAFAEANKIAYQETGVVDKVEWRTSEDERVCPICGPLADKRDSIDDPQFGGVGIPPAHPRCRCWIVPVI